MYWDKTGKQAGGESVWNFHVWNDVWFRRQDLGEEKYNGWQALDATPQETSDGKYQCGPCPLPAVKEGEKVIYDNDFIFAEVNADIEDYQEQDDGTYKLASVRTSYVGKEISTKLVGKLGRHDITSEYKYPEGSAEERASAETDPKQGKITVVTTIPDKHIGETIPVTITLTAAQDVTAVAVVTTNAITRKGQVREEVKKVEQNVNVPGDGSPVSFSFDVKLEEYLPFLSGFHHFQIRTLVQLDDGPTLTFQDYDLDEPVPEIVVDKNLVSGQGGEIKVNFQNPLSVPLTNVIFSIEGSGVTQRQRVPVGTINPAGVGSAVFQLKDQLKSGNRTIKVIVISSELAPVHAGAHVTVQ